MKELYISGAYVIIVAILVLGLGNAVTKRVPFLQKYSIPMAVTGGLVCSIAILIIGKAGGPRISFDLELRDVLLVAFFSTIGLSAKFSRLAAGGKALAILTACAAAFLFIQNGTGVLLAKLLGAHPGLGLFAGSISLAGGHGTAIAWGQEAAKAGITEAELVGIAFATFGLVAGGIIGGPISEFLIKKNNLSPTNTPVEGGSADRTEVPSEKLEPVTLERALSVLFILAVCVAFGEVVNEFLFARDFRVPGFLTAMLVGIFITNISDKLNRPIRLPDFDKTGSVCLQLFLAMSLMSMDLSSLAGAFGFIFVVLCAQILVLTLFAVFIIFRLMGKDYDAAVIVGGFCGLGMGATPVAIANMSAITKKYAPSFKAFLVVPLVGAFFIDILNALIIKFFLDLPIMQPAAEAAT
ncbi:MAG: sodium/glutamate symporter, partial [Verrucomicrobiota bacterium]